MTKRTKPTIEAVLLTILLGILGFSLFATPAPAARDQVVLTGWLHVEDRTVDDLVLSVEVADNCLYAEVESTGRFTVVVPVGYQVTLSFSKPGHLPKEVVIDTRYSMMTEKAQRTNRKVKFDVVMEPLEKRPGRKYDGPVGSLSFFRGTGTMKVKHNLRVVAE